MMNEILEYLKSENPDFNQGFSLFCLYSRNESLMSWIGRKKDMEKLIHELKKLSTYKLSKNPAAEGHFRRYNKFPSSSETIAPAAVPDSDLPVFKTYDERRTRRADLPENLQKVYDDIAGDYKLRKAYHEKMKIAKEDQERASLRASILETQERITKGWQLIDGYLLEQDQKKMTENFKESTCRSYITKALKKESLSPEQVEKLRLRVKALVDHDCPISDELKKKLKSLKVL